MSTNFWNILKNQFRNNYIKDNEFSSITNIIGEIGKDFLFHLAKLAENKKPVTESEKKVIDNITSILHTINTIEKEIKKHEESFPAPFPFIPGEDYSKYEADKALSAPNLDALCESLDKQINALKENLEQSGALEKNRKVTKLLNTLSKVTDELISKFTSGKPWWETPSSGLKR